MRKQNRRCQSAKFKARVAMKPIQGIKLASEIVAEYEIHPVQESEQKKNLMKNMGYAFAKDTIKKKNKDFISERNALQGKVSKLTMKVECLQKKYVQFGLNIDDT